MIDSHIRTMTRRDWTVAFALALLLSICGVLGASYVAGSGTAILDASSTFALIVLFTFVFVGLLILGDIAFGRLVQAKVPKLFDRITPQWSLRSVLIFAAIMGIFWLPWFIANFPGSTYWDTYYQIYQVYPENHPIAIIPWSDVYQKTLTDAWLVDHHPVLTTMIYGAFGWLSDQLTGNWMAGVFTFVCLQGIAYLLTFTAACAYMRRVGCPRLIVFLTYTFFAIMPFVSTWSLCMVKDSLFGLFFVWYFIFLVEMMRKVKSDSASCAKTSRLASCSMRSVVLFSICALMLCLTKKTGLFVVIPTAIVLAVHLWRSMRQSPDRPERRKLVWQALMPAIVSIIIAGVILPFVAFPALNIAPGGKQEVLGPLFQQTARYVVDHGDEVTEEEHAAIAKVLDYDRLESAYDFDFEDSVKYRFNLEATNEDILEYLEVYAEQGLKHPDSYAAAFWGLAGFYVAPTAYINIRMVTVDTKMGPDKRYMLWNPDELDWLRNGLDEAYSAVASVPGLNLPLLIVTYVLWLPALLFFCMFRRRARAAVLFVPFVVLGLFCVIAPVYDARYVIPIFDCIPLVVCAAALSFTFTQQGSGKDTS